MKKQYIASSSEARYLDMILRLQCTIAVLSVIIVVLVCALIYTTKKLNAQMERDLSITNFPPMVEETMGREK